ncbi:MAG TPA: hypothetical protein VFR34_12995 [Paracoccaceae bacterium]|nr:hypothetical protein [Paracoccaceae bacterium]
MARLLPALLLLLLAACAGDSETPGSLGPDLARIRIVNVETRVAQNADIWFARADANAQVEEWEEAEPDDPVYRTPREREAAIREEIAAGVNEAVVEALRGLPSGDLPVIAEVTVTRYRIRSLLRGAMLGSDHAAEAILTLRNGLTGQPASEPLTVRAESTEQVAVLGGLALRAVRPSPSRRLNENLAAEIRAALDRVAART